MRRILVTGGAGFIGANFVHYCLDKAICSSVVVLDSLAYAGNVANLTSAFSDPRFTFVHGDICDAELVGDLLVGERIDCIVHFAAESHVDRSIEGPDEFIRTNVVGTHTLLKAARSCWSRDGRYQSGVRFHHVSTDEVFGSLDADAPGFTETTSYAPNSPYSASKAASDHLVRAYGHTFGVPVTTSNCSNNYGPYQFPEKLIPLMLVSALEGRPLPVYGRGENVRDWLHVEDHCHAVAAILESGIAGETYNIGGGNEWRNIDIVHLLCRLIEDRFEADPQLRERFPDCPAATRRPVADLIEFVADRPGHDWRYAIDGSKIRRELGFEPSVDFESGISRTVDWYLVNETWWRAVLSGEYRTLQIPSVDAVASSSPQPS